MTWPMLLAGLGVGALASQLGSVTVSSVPDEQSGEVGGLQNTITNLGISIGTALTGAIIIATLTTSFLTGIEQNPAVPASVKSQAKTQLAGGVPFISDEDLKTALNKAHVPPEHSGRHRRGERDRANRRAALGAVGAGGLRVARAVLQPPDPDRTARCGGGNGRCLGGGAGHDRLGPVDDRRRLDDVAAHAQLLGVEPEREPDELGEVEHRHAQRRGPTTSSASGCWRSRLRWHSGQGVTRQSASASIASPRWRPACLSEASLFIVMIGKPQHL